MYSQQVYQGPNAVSIIQQRSQTVKNIIPGIFPGFLATFQLFLWIIIIILEIVSIYYDAGRGTIYAGLWCSTIFFITWISMFCYLCCGKSARCETYLIVQNIINLIFAIILLSFTVRFLNDPCLCYGALCWIPNWDFIKKVYDDDNDDNYIYSCTSRTLKKIPALKGLLACSILMLICNIVFIGTYLVISVRLRVRAKSYAQTPDVIYQQRTGSVHWGEQSSFSSSNMNYSPEQQPPSYPIQNTQAQSQWPSAPPPPYETCLEKF